MRRYDDPVEVRRGMVPGPGGSQEGPEQFLWRGRLWKVGDVLAHWVETGPWWQSRGAEAVHGTEGLDEAGTGGGVGLAAPVDLLAEREVWRVEAGAGAAAGSGLYDLCFDWTTGGWTLARVLD